MTTLPTTSSIRLPRSGGPGGQVLAMPGIAMGPVAPQAQESLLTPGDIWRILRRSWLLIMIFVTVGAAIGVGLYVYQLKTNPRWTATATILIRPDVRIDPRNNQTTLLGEDVFDLRVEMRTHTQLLMQPNLWDSVIDSNPKMKETKWYKAFESEVAGRKEQDVTPMTLARENLLENFKVVPVTDTKLLKISMETPDAQDSVDIIQSIVDEHIKQRQKNTSDRTSNDLDQANKWRDRYGYALIGITDRMNTLNASINDGGATRGGSSGVHEMEISHLMGKLVEIRMDTNATKAQLESLEQIINKGETPPAVESMLRNDPLVQRYQAEADNADADLERIQGQGMGKENKIVKEVIARAESAHQRLQNQTAKARSLYRDQLLEQARATAQSFQSQEDALTQQIDQRRSELSEITGKVAEYLSLKDEAETYKVMKREMEDRVAVLKAALTDSRSGGVAWSNSGGPTKPDKRSSPRLPVYLVGAMMIGLAAALGIAFLREIMDTTVRSPRDIARVGPMNLLGMIADESDDPQLAGVPLHAVISQAPQSVMAEQIRQVRTRLQHAASLDTTRTIVITSPGPGDGKSMVACNLAAGLALNGRRILLVDANFRRPELHRLFGVPNEVGFANVLDSVSNLESAVQKTSTPNLELLTTGPKASNPTELLESQLFSDFIDRALEEYDHVIFDTGPLLVVSEAVALAPRVDGVITVVRARVNSRGMLVRVRDTLKQIKAEHLGIVLNGVQTWGGGYYGRTIKTYYAYQNAPE